MTSTDAVNLQAAGGKLFFCPSKTERRDDYGDGQQDKQMLDKFREARLRWLGHLLRTDSEDIDGRMLRMEMPGGRPRGRATTGH